MVVLLRKLIEHLNAERFIADFFKDPEQQTQLIRELVKREGRYAFNFPWLGFARKISKKMTEQGVSFSDFYDYEKKIAALFHPRLSKIGLNIYADIFIDRYLAKRSKSYLPEFNKLSKRQIKQSDCEELFKKIFLSDGHRLIIALLDIFRKKDKHNKELFDILVVLEKDVLQIKNSLSANDDKNKKLVKRYYDQYQRQSQAGFFKTRLLWDDVLRNYLPAEETAQKKEGASSQWQKVNEQYAEDIKKKYLDQLPDDEQQLEKVLDAVLASNKKAGKDDVKTEAIVAKIVEKCLDDEKFPEAKKNMLQDIFKEKFPNSKVFEEDQTKQKRSEVAEVEAAAETKTISEEDDDLMDIKFSDDEEGSKESAVSLEQDDFSDDKPTEYVKSESPDPQDEASSLKDRSIEDEEAKTKKDVTFDGSEQKEDDTENSLAGDINEFSDLLDQLNDADLWAEKGSEEESAEAQERSAVESTEESDERNAVNKVLEEDEDSGSIEETAAQVQIAIADAVKPDELGKFIISAKKEFAELIRNLSEEERQLLKVKFSGLYLSADEEEKVQAVFNNLFAAVSAENSDKYLKEIIKERGNFFARLMHHLIDMAEQLTVREMRVYVDSLITSLEKNRFLLQEYPHLIERLINFRDSLKEQPTQLLNEIYTGLKKIDDEKGDDLLAAISAKYNYLKSCLAMEKYFAVRKTIIKITENLLERPDEHTALIEPDEPLKEDVLNKVQGELGADPLTWVNGILQGDFNEDDEILLQATKEFLNENRDILEGSGFNLKKILQNKNCPPNILQVTKKIAAAVNGNKFQEAVNAIVFSANPPQIKIKFLESLKIIAFKKGWLNDDPQDTAAVKRGRFLESKINYYKKLIGINVSKKNRTEVSDGAVNKNRETRPVPEQTKGAENKIDEKQKITAEKDLTEIDDAELTQEQLIDKALLKIVKEFGDNIDIVIPVLDKVCSSLPPECYEATLKERNAVSKRKQQLIKNTLAMIKNKTAELEQLEIVHNASAVLQYYWREAIIKETAAKGDKNKAALLVAFDGLKNNAEVYALVARLNRIIDTNNSQDALVNALNEDKNLIAKIEENFTEEGLKLLWQKERNTKRKAKIRSFRELLKLTGEKSAAVKKDSLAVKKENNRANNLETEEDVKKEVIAVEDTAKRVKPAKDYFDFFKDINTSLNSKNERLKNLVFKKIETLNLELFMAIVNEDDAALAWFKQAKDDELVHSVFMTLVKTPELNKSANYFGKAISVLVQKKIIDRVYLNG